MHEVRQQQWQPPLRRSTKVSAGCAGSRPGLLRGARAAYAPDSKNSTPRAFILVGSDEEIAAGGNAALYTASSP